jgi:hypothetical protein
LDIDHKALVEDGAKSQRGLPEITIDFQLSQDFDLNDCESEAETAEQARKHLRAIGEFDMVV